MQGDIGFEKIFDDTKDDATYKVNTRAILDKSTYALKEIHWSGSGNTTLDGTKVPYIFTIDLIITPLDENYEITIPDGVIKSSEEGLLTLKSDDSKAEIKVPVSWSEFDKTDTPQASIYAGNEKDDAYLIVICEDKMDMSDDMSLNDYNSIVSKQMTENVVDPKVSEASNLTINSMNALQYEISGEYEKIKVRYLVTVMESNSKFYQIVTWSLQSTFDKNKSILKKVADSFEEIQ